MAAVDGDDHIVRYANPAFHQLLGRENDTLVGTKFEDVVPSIGVGVGSVLIDRVLATGRLQQQPVEGRDPGVVGVPCTNWLLSMWPVGDEMALGVVIHVTDLCFSEDLLRESTTINEALLLSAIREHELRDALIQSEERYRALYGALPVAAFLCDKQGVIQNYNARAAELWGRRPEIGVERCSTVMTLFRMNGVPLLPEENFVAQVLLDGIPIRNVEMLIERPDGSRIPITINFSALRGRDGEILGAVTSFDDISERIKAEEAMVKAQAALTELAAVLEHRVVERTAELLSSNEQLQGFTYSVAHDLRQQIRGISMNASMVLNDNIGALDAGKQGNLRRLVQCAKQLGTLVDDLLGYARLTKLEPKAIPFNLSEMAGEVSRYVLDQIYCNPDTRFEIDPGLTAVGDPMMVQIVLGNLIDNACKYSAQTPKPVVEIGQDDQGFFVRDNGIGFEMEYAHKLFLPLERLHAAHEYSGTGIGLANVKRIIERHGGRVWAESELGKGSTFHFTLTSAP